MANTVWFVVFNNPENCVTGHTDDSGVNCGLDDIFGSAYNDSVENGNPDPSLISPNLAANLGVIYGGGGYSNKQGRLHVTASLWRTDGILSSNPAVDPMGLGTGWTNRDGAEIHVVIRSHGKRKRGDFLTNVDQLTQFNDPYCTDPNLGHVGEFAKGNICRDIQVVPFSPTERGGEEDGFKMILLSSGESIPESRAVLHRNGDHFQVFIGTNVFHGTNIFT